MKAQTTNCEETMLEARRLNNDVFQGEVRVRYQTAIRDYRDGVLERVTPAGKGVVKLDDGTTVRVDAGGDNVLLVSGADLSCIVNHFTAFANLWEMFHAHPTYRPTLRGGFYYAVIANHYDLMMRANKTPRRAYRGDDARPFWVEQEEKARTATALADRHFEMAIAALSPSPQPR